MTRPIGLADYLRDFDHQGGVIVCEQPKFVYMKAPRTGGTSILRKTLEPALPRIFHHKDSPGWFAQWIDDLDDSHLEEYFIFSFVRNPWDRFVSLAFYFDIGVRELAHDFAHYQQRDNLRLHSLPLYSYTHCNRANFCDFVGRFENLQPDFDEVCRRIGLGSVRLPHTSRTRHDHYSRYFDAETRQAVGTIYACDVEAFGYQFSED